MGRNTIKRKAGRTQKKLTLQETMDLSLRKYHAPGVSPFKSAGLRKAAWLQHRETMMALCEGTGRRPGGWWEHEAPGQLLELISPPWEDNGLAYDFPHLEEEIAALVRLKVATPEEVELFRKWHETTFDRPETLRTSWRRIEYEHERKLLADLEAGE